MGTESKKRRNYNGASNIFCSLQVTTKNGYSVKIVFVRNRNKKSECLFILSTDTSLSDSYDIQDMDITNALQSLMALFVDIVKTFSAQITEMIKNQVSNWIASQATFVQAMFGDLCWES